MNNELYGLQIRLKALRARRDKAAAALQITEAERINADILRVKAMIEERTKQEAS
jgi:hypothetical protein